MRPTTLDEVVGQEHIISTLESCCTVRSRRINSAPSFSTVPPGTGKTTLARVIANTTSAEFTQLNATTAGKRIWKKS